MKEMVGSLYSCKANLVLISKILYSLDYRLCINCSIVVDEIDSTSSSLQEWHKDPPVIDTHKVYDYNQEKLEKLERWYYQVKWMRMILKRTMKNLSLLTQRLNYFPSYLSRYSAPDIFSLEIMRLSDHRFLSLINFFEEYVLDEKIISVGSGKLLVINFAKHMTEVQRIFETGVHCYFDGQKIDRAFK